jgi:hypothetical protein
VEFKESQQPQYPAAGILGALEEQDSWQLIESKLVLNQTNLSPKDMHCKLTEH